MISINNWHRWYAWHPTAFGEHTAWLKYVERRRINGEWYYRLIPEDREKLLKKKRKQFNQYRSDVDQALDGVEGIINMAHALDYESRINQRPVDWEAQVKLFLETHGKDWSYEAQKDFCINNYPGITPESFDRIFEKG